MIQTTDKTAIDCTKYETLSSIEAVCSVPSETDLRFVFKIGNGKWQKYDTAAKKWTDISGDATVENILKVGNTPKEVQSLGRAELFPFVGKSVGFAIAAKYDNSNPNVPVVSRFSFVDDSVPCGSTVVMNADAPVQILGIDVDKKEVGGGKCTLIASIQDAAGVWSIYREYHEYLKTATLAKAIKFRAIYSVQNVSPDSVTLNSISVTYRSSSKKGATNSVCMTKAFTFPRKISSVHMILKHPEALDMKFQPKVAFKNAVTDVGTWIPMAQDDISEDEKTGLLVDEFDYVASSDEAGTIVTLRVDMKGNTGSVKDQALGSGTGAVTTYHLPHSALSNTITVSPADAVWNYKSKDRSVDITARAGTPVSISYDWESETTYLDSMSCVFSE